MIAASFFTGIGGLDLAAIAAGFDVQFMCEIDDYNRAVLAHHFPNVPIAKDIKHVKACDLPPGTDLIFGGFPCTDISNANANGAGLGGVRSGLWFELARIIRDAQPRFVILENVSALTFRGGTTVTAQLASMGYDGFWFTVPAYTAGSPQYRTRWFYVGYTNRQRRQKPQPAKLDCPGIRASRTEQPLPKRRSALATRQGSRAFSRSQYRRVRSKSSVGGDAYGFPTGLDILNHEFPSGSWQPQKPSEPARLSPPDEERAYRIKALGNAVVPQQAYPVFKALYQFAITT